MPKVSICIPQYNRCESLRVVLGDILSQTFQDFELIIVDDVSTDQTIEVVSGFNDSRIKYFRNDHNLGLYPNFNRCLELAHGEYVAIYHNHDRYDPTIVQKSVEILDCYPEIGFIHTGTVTKRQYSENDHFFVREWDFQEQGRKFAGRMLFRWDSLIHQPTVMARRSMFEQVGVFDDEYYDSSADSALWIKMCLIADIGYIAQPLMRITPRIEEDRYGKFNWLSIRGMARVHQLGLNLLFPEENLVKRFLRFRLRLHTDSYYVFVLLQWLGKSRMDYVEKGKEIIQEDCSDLTNMIVKKVLIYSTFLIPILRFARWITRNYINIKEKIESRNGKYIFSRYESPNGNSPQNLK
jgi:glycosyltransferase involved in cell wall biosynthesis